MHLFVTQFLKLGMLLGFCVPFLLYCTFNIVCLKILPQTVTCMACICGRDVRGENLVGRNHIETEILMSVLQPMKNLNCGR